MRNKSRNIYSSVSNMVGGFSLVELVIIIVVIGLSSGIAVPILTSTQTKAKLSEADAALSNLRTQLRIYHSQNGEYPIAKDAIVVADANWFDIASGRLSGKYFSDESYTYVSKSGSEFTLICEAGNVLDSDRTINQSGVISGGI